MADMLTQDQVDRIYQVTDAYRLHRAWIVVPLKGADQPQVRMLPDAKIIVLAPGGPDFDLWFPGFRAELDRLPLHRVPQSTEQDPKRPVSHLRYGK